MNSEELRNKLGNNPHKAIERMKEGKLPKKLSYEIEPSREPPLLTIAGDFDIFSMAQFIENHELVHSVDFTYYSTEGNVVRYAVIFDSGAIETHPDFKHTSRNHLIMETLIEIIGGKLMEPE